MTAAVDAPNAMARATASRVEEKPIVRIAQMVMVNVKHVKVMVIYG